MFMHYTHKNMHNLAKTSYCLKWKLNLQEISPLIIIQKFIMCIGYAHTGVIIIPKT